MNHLSLVYLFKIGGTLLLWCVPLLFFPTALATALITEGLVAFGVFGSDPAVE